MSEELTFDKLAYVLGEIVARPGLFKDAYVILANPGINEFILPIINDPPWIEYDKIIIELKLFKWGGSVIRLGYSFDVRLGRPVIVYRSLDEKERAMI
jgi:hypothetical protein